MKAEGGSRTAVVTCQGRAVADGRVAPGRFSDPVAFALLRPQEREAVEQVRAGVAPTSMAQRMAYEAVRAAGSMMASRTVAIDDALRTMPGGEPPAQVVLLGAGLDSRAWRMNDLVRTDVYEVDHPASQDDKRDRLNGWSGPVLARSVSFVAVDFAKDVLGDALGAAGFKAEVPTAWVWEGVVPYLTRAQVRATTRAVAGLSAPGSRLVVMYLAPSLKASAGIVLARAMSLAARRRSMWADEPRRSSWSRAAMDAMLADHGFTVTSDESLLEASARLGIPGERRVSSASARLALADRPA